MRERKKLWNKRELDYLKRGYLATWLLGDLKKNYLLLKERLLGY